MVQDISEAVLQYRTRTEPEAGMQNSQGRYPVCAEKPYVNQFVVQLVTENPHT